MKLAQAVANLFGVKVKQPRGVSEVNESREDAPVKLACEAAASVLSERGDTPRYVLETVDGFIISGDRQAILLGDVPDNYKIKDLPSGIEAVQTPATTPPAIETEETDEDSENGIYQTESGLELRSGETILAHEDCDVENADAVETSIEALKGAAKEFGMEEVALDYNEDEDMFEQIYSELTNTLIPIVNANAKTKLWGEAFDRAYKDRNLSGMLLAAESLAVAAGFTLEATVDEAMKHGMDMAKMGSNKPMKAAMRSCKFSMKKGSRNESEEDTIALIAEGFGTTTNRPGRTGSLKVRYKAGKIKAPKSHGSVRESQLDEMDKEISDRAYAAGKGAKTSADHKKAADLHRKAAAHAKENGNKFREERHTVQAKSHDNMAKGTSESSDSDQDYLMTANKAFGATQDAKDKKGHQKAQDAHTEAMVHPNCPANKMAEHKAGHNYHKAKAAGDEKEAAKHKPTLAVGLARLKGHFSDESVQEGKYGEKEARATAGEWHGGQSSKLYAFASSGKMLPGLDVEIKREQGTAPDTEKSNLAKLLDYVKVNMSQDTGASGQGLPNSGGTGPKGPKELPAPEAGKNPNLEKNKDMFNKIGNGKNATASKMKESIDEWVEKVNSLDVDGAFSGFLQETANADDTETFRAKANALVEAYRAGGPNKKSIARKISKGNSIIKAKLGKGISLESVQPNYTEVKVTFPQTLINEFVKHAKTCGVRNDADVTVMGENFEVTLPRKDGDKLALIFDGNGVKYEQA